MPYVKQTKQYFSNTTFHVKNIKIYYGYFVISLLNDDLKYKKYAQLFLTFFLNQHKDLTIDLNSNPKPIPKFEDGIKFGTITSNHMLEIDWEQENGWSEPKIVPYSKFDLDPINCGIQHALSCFDGLKVFYGADGKYRLFRPELNMERFRLSCKRIALPVIVN